MGVKADDKHSVLQSEKCDELMGGKSVETLVVDEQRESTFHPAKRRKVSYIWNDA